MYTEKNEKVTQVAFVICESFEYFISLFVSTTMLGYLLDTLGFSDSVQGILGTITTFACTAQLFALFLSERRVKKICITGNVINQIFFVILYLLPLFELDANLRTLLFLILLICGHIINNAVRSSKITMYMASVPFNKRGSFTAVKEMFSLAGGITISLAMGRVADVFRSENGLPTKEYYVICAVTLIVMTFIHTGSVVAATEKAPTKAKAKTPLKEVIVRISKNRSFVKVIIVGILWNVSTALSISFFASYLREELAFNFTTIALFSTASAITRILASPLLGKIADKYSFATSMTISFSLAALGFLAMVFTAPTTKWLYVIYTCLYGFSMAGINSGVINLIYDYVEDRDRAAAMGVKNALGGILAFFTALISGAIMASIQENRGFNILGTTLYAQQVLSILSLVTVIILIIYMRVVVAPLKRVEDIEKGLQTEKD